ncbi:NUDIX domain-containing protein [Salinigranum rubrum]|uniref:NUDIX domain-containing protein n=1 Tax=Salinigranum rubrum TaxID=755307 RepID=UPI00268422B7|nr:NUDIX domain-containing protein [Salinigranum rubrum]
MLLVRRSDEVGTYRGKWGAVSGYAEGDPEAAARWEIAEETGLADAVTVVRRGDPLAFTDDDRSVRWVVHPFLFDCSERGVTPNEEVAETAWVAPPEIRRRETVPKLWEAYDRVRPTVRTVETDTDHGSAWLSLRALEVLRDEAGLASEDDAGETGWERLVDVAAALLDARPSMTALGNRVNRAMTEASEADRRPESVERAAHDGIGRALDADRSASRAVAERLAGEHVLTLSRSGTVERALSRGGESEGPAHVYVAESRPAREGVGVAERLAEAGVGVTLLTDAAVAHVLSGGLGSEVERVVVGADTVLPDGSVVNKTGTRGVAIAASNESVPVDVVTATDKVATTATVAGEEGPAEAVYDGDEDVAAANPTFDRTPAAFVARFVTERGALEAEDVAAVADELRALAAWQD